MRTELFIGGEFVPGAEGRTFETLNPASARPIASVSAATAADVDAAVRAGWRAFEGDWGALALQDRARLLRRVVELMVARRDNLARLESLDAGKPIRDCGSQIDAAIAWFDWFADVALKVRTHVIPGVADTLNYTLRQPFGVVGAITPWNYPLVLYSIKVAPALAMGNAVLLKPAEQTPLTALALAEICAEAGLPAGALNILPGGPEAGEAIVAHPRVPCVSFTGSTAVGREIMARSAQPLKKVSLELGGKSPNIVFADADLDAAARTSLWTFCVNAGQLCSAGTRLLVQRSVHDRLVERIVSEALALRVGDPALPETQVGAVISAEQLDRIAGYVEIGRVGGGEVVVGGERALVPGLEGGFFHQPTIFDNVDPAHRIAQEEIFGPVLSVIPFEDEAHAVDIANGVMYGLAAGVWTSDVKRAHRVAARMDAGLVYVNTMNLLSPGSPYSGFKQSGVGVEGGFEQALGFTQLKSVWLNLGDVQPVL